MTNYGEITVRVKEVVGLNLRSGEDALLVYYHKSSSTTSSTDVKNSMEVMNKMFPKNRVLFIPCV